ncbi:MAG TPA: hypothetical protein VMD56_02720 [Steroidobacteraceae bacterium]|nr:hypothetical protein [Steroidobacteraceae bacterium]
MLEEPEMPPLGGAWDRALLGPVADINERMLECLHGAALAGAAGTLGAAHTGVPLEPAAGVAARAPALLSQLAPLWQALDAAALRRLAGCPYLLIDVGFDQPERWERLQACAVRDSPADGYFRGPEGVALLRRTLVFAWHLARSNRLGARVLLGMGPRTAECIAQLRLQDLDTLPERGCPWAAPRWERRPQVWRQLLGAATGPQAQLQYVQLHGLQLLAAERQATRA